MKVTYKKIPTKAEMALQHERLCNEIKEAEKEEEEKEEEGTYDN
jgi:hypothetical protein